MHEDIQPTSSSKERGNAVAQSRNFYISDTHYFHRNVLNFEKRPWPSVEDMTEGLIALHNSVVTSKDNVYILGDFAFTRDGHTVHDLTARLNGKLHLIKGNHDDFIGRRNFNPGCFEWIKDIHELRDQGHRVILCHYPMAVWNCSHHGSLHLYGHVHDNAATNHPLVLGIENAYNVSACLQDYTPQTLEQVLARYGRQ